LAKGPLYVNELIHASGLEPTNIKRNAFPSKVSQRIHQRRKVLVARQSRDILQGNLNDGH
jgi:hypothetical protein